MGEEIGTDMALRAIDNILQYGEVNLRRVVPLAVCLLSVSHPRVNVIDTLSKLSHDNDEIVSQNAILAMGIAGAGEITITVLAGFLSLCFPFVTPIFVSDVYCGCSLCEVGGGVPNVARCTIAAVIVNALTTALAETFAG